MRCSLSSSDFVVGDGTRRRLACTLMILPDDTVLNISASSAETHVHTLKRKRRIHMLMRATKAKTTAKKSSFFFHGHRSQFAFHETSEHRQQSRISPSRARAARSFNTQISFTCIWTDCTRERPFPFKNTLSVSTVLTKIPTTNTVCGPAEGFYNNQWVLLSAWGKMCSWLHRLKRNVLCHESILKFISEQDT